MSDRTRGVTGTVTSGGMRMPSAPPSRAASSGSWSKGMGLEPREDRGDGSDRGEAGSPTQQGGEEHVERIVGHGRRPFEVERGQ